MKNLVGRRKLPRRLEQKPPHHAQGETRQALAARQEYENELHREDQMLILAKTQFDEMQSQMHQMLAKMKQQEVLIRELNEARE